MTFAGLLGPFAAVLAVSGLTKLRRPATVGATLGALGLPPGPAAGRLLGLVEVSLGVLLLATGGAWLTALATAWYTGLTIVSIVLVRRDDAVPCGCFGAGSAPPGGVHVAANAVGAILFALATVIGPASLTGLVIDAPVAGALLGLQVALGTWMLLAVYRDLPRVGRILPAPVAFELTDGP